MVCRDVIDFLLFLFRLCFLLFVCFLTLLLQRRRPLRGFFAAQMGSADFCCGPSSRQLAARQVLTARATLRHAAARRTKAELHANLPAPQSRSSSSRATAHSLPGSTAAAAALSQLTTVSALLPVPTCLCKLLQRTSPHASLLLVAAAAAPPCTIARCCCCTFPAPLEG